MQSAPILLSGKSAILTTNGSGGTASSVAVPVGSTTVTSLGLGSNRPPQLRLLNIGTAVIWLSFTSPAAATAIIPTAGTTTLGTPQSVLWLYPLIEISLTIPCSMAPLASSDANQGHQGFWVNMISAAASQSFYFQMGDGT